MEEFHETRRQSDRVRTVRILDEAIRDRVPHLAYINLRRLSADSECSLVRHALYAFYRRRIIKHDLCIPFTTTHRLNNAPEISPLATREEKRISPAISRQIKHPLELGNVIYNLQTILESISCYQRGDTRSDKRKAISMAKLKIDENKINHTIYAYGSRLPAVPRMSLCLVRSSSPFLFAFHFPNLRKRKVTGEKANGARKKFGSGASKSRACRLRQVVSGY